MDERLLLKVKKLNEIFKNYKEIICVYLFGSVVKGRSRKEGDIDLGILLEKDIKDKGEFIYEVERNLDFKIEPQIVDLKAQDLTFQHNVIREGKILYEGNRSKRVKFEMEIMKEFSLLEPKLRFLEGKLPKSYKRL